MVDLWVRTPWHCMTELSPHGSTLPIAFSKLVSAAACFPKDQAAPMQ